MTNILNNYLAEYYQTMKATINTKQSELKPNTDGQFEVFYTNHTGAKRMVDFPSMFEALDFINRFPNVLLPLNDRPAVVVRKKLCIIGHARHGKDSVAEFIKAAYGYAYKSSSEAAAELFLLNQLKEKYGYLSVQECLDDRFNHRDEWFKAISKYNQDDPARLAKKIMSYNDIYVGMRSRRELAACIEQNVFDFVLGVFNPHKTLEANTSFELDVFSQSNAILINSGDKNALKESISLLKIA